MTGGPAASRRADRDMLISNIRAGYVTDDGVHLLAVLLASLPAMLVFLILQRSFAEGITGAIK